MTGWIVVAAIAAGFYLFGFATFMTLIGTALLVFGVRATFRRDSPSGISGPYRRYEEPSYRGDYDDDSDGDGA